MPDHLEKVACSQLPLLPCLSRVIHMEISKSVDMRRPTFRGIPPNVSLVTRKPVKELCISCEYSAKQEKEQNVHERGGGGEWHTLERTWSRVIDIQVEELSYGHLSLGIAQRVLCVQFLDTFRVPHPLAIVELRKDELTQTVDST